MITTNVKMFISFFKLICITPLFTYVFIDHQQRKLDFQLHVFYMPSISYYIV